VALRERPQHDRAHRPARHRDAERRHVAGDGPAEDVVARPEQRGQRQQQV